MRDLAEELRRIAQLISGNEIAAAGERCEAVIRAHPGSADAFRLLALIEDQHGRPEQAYAAISQAIALNPRDAVCLNIQGVLLAAQNRLTEALTVFDRACAARPDFLPAIMNRGLTLLDLERPQEALDCFDGALALNAANVEAVLRRGRALHALGRLDEALASAERAASVSPRLGEAHLLRAEILRMVNRPDEALQAFDAVLAFDQNNPLALQNSATLLHQLGRLDQAIPRYERLIGGLRTIDGTGVQLDYALAMAVSCRRTMCAWPGMLELEAELVERVRKGGAKFKPFLSLFVTDEPDIQALCARRTWDQQFASLPPGDHSPHARSRRHERLRVGYISGDFRDHPTAWLIAGLIEDHDRANFDVLAFSNCGDDGSLIRQRLILAFDEFVDISALDDASAAELIRSHDIDILVDLNGLTDFSRIGVITHQAAPITVHYLGYPGPMGAPALDYLIADDVVIPHGAEEDYDCAIVRLPGSYQVNDQRRELPDQIPTRQQVGLPPTGFVFCGFCQSLKLSPPVFDAWMHILVRVPDSVIWLLEDNRYVRENLRSEAQARRVDPARLVFAPRVVQAQHLARHLLADVVLDTWPCGAHTSTSDALWMGIPVITKPGRSFASRVAASILLAAGLPELVTDHLDAYEDLAVELAQSPGHMAEVRAKLRASKASCPLFDTNRFRRNIETAYAEMWARFVKGGPPAGFSVRQ